MKTPEVSVDVKGSVKAALDIRELGERAGDVRHLGDELQRIFAKGEERRFARSGPGWTPLAASTLDRKQREGLDARVLRATDTLYDSLVNAYRPLETTSDEVHFGTDVAYAVFHQLGRGVPERTVVAIDPTSEREMTAAITRYIVDGEGL